MGINIIKNKEGVEFHAFGAINGCEVIQARNKIYDAEYEAANYKYFLFNNLHCTEYNITAADITFLANLDIKALRKNPAIIMATVESEHLMFSLTEVWHAHIEDYIAKKNFFMNRHSAINWIKNQIE